MRIYGSKARLGRIMGKSPKKGIIMTISGTRKSDSLVGQTNIPMIGKLRFQGVFRNGSLEGKLLNTDAQAIGTLNGILSKETQQDYRRFYPMLIQTVSQNIYSKSELQTTEWRQFEKDLEKVCERAKDDIEFYFGVNMLTQKLPFSHLMLTLTTDLPGDSPESQASESDPSSVILEKRDAHTAYLKIKNFSSSAEELEKVLPQIVSDTACRNLIVDLRNNGGGGISAAFAFAKYIVDKDIEVGYFVTNKFQYSGFDPKSFATLPLLQPQSTHEFGMYLRNNPGARLVFRKSNTPVFTGNLYVLTNNRTGSTCEPIVYALKSGGKATIIGENTAGAMLSASPYVLSGKYVLMLPVADFYTRDGIRLDGVGVAPDVEIPFDQAEAKALEMITQRESGQAEK